MQRGDLTRILSIYKITVPHTLQLPALYLYTLDRVVVAVAVSIDKHKFCDFGSN